MPRSPKPWYWEARGAWYVQINKKQHRLHENKKEAEREFYRMMAAEGRLEQRQSAKMTVADACEAYLANYQHNRKSTIDLATDRLADFVGHFGGRRLDSLKPGEVIKWLAAYQGRDPKVKAIGDSTRALHFRLIKQVFRWCRDTGVLDIDPFIRAPNPWRIPRRDSPMSDEVYERVMSLPKVSPEFKRVVELVWRTGIRPGELCILAARHMDARQPIARFQPTEYKTGSKTGLQREVFFPADLWEQLKLSTETHRQGPLIRKANGNPWTQKEISERWGKLRSRYSLGCCLYQARHRWATAMLESGIPAHRVAKMAGHVNPKVLLSTYYHPEAAKMADDADRVMGQDAGADQVKRIADRVEAERAEMRERNLEKDRVKHRKLYEKHKRKPKPPASDS